MRRPVRSSALAVALACTSAAGCSGEREPLNYEIGQWGSYEGSPSSNKLTIYFSTGAPPDDRENACYQPRRVTASETATTVTVRLELSGRQGPFGVGVGCTDEAVGASEVVTLRAPLGKRVVRDAARPSAVPSARRK